MAEYIEREKIYADISRFLIDKDSADLTDCEDGWTSAISKAMDVIKDVLAADVRPERHGKWITWEEAGNFIPSPDRYECSVCHDVAQRLCNGIDLLSDYCPNCGAKMDGKENKDG